jgi:hypothetical protein
MCLPLDDRPPALQPEPAPPVEQQTPTLPGLALELGTAVDNVTMALADLRLAQSQDNLAALEARLEKLAALATHARKTVTAARVRERRE